ncbi:alpha-mannosidase 2 [Ditylenchus destructor]|nr:alpha-mannosidase 2 [Ditylenchus destructor]
MHLNISRNIKMSFMQYGVRPVDDNLSVIPGHDTHSGAYLFLPDGPARPLSNIDTSYVIIRGPVRNSVVVKHSGPVPILHAVNLDIGSDSLQIHNLVDIRNQSDFELIMRMETNDATKKPLTDFYTELNGLQMIHRKRYKRLPLQAHFYPMPGAAILQNGQERLTVIGRQPLGVASLKPGQIEIVLDRRLAHDDGRGMGEGVMDNRLTESRFRLMLEPIKVDSTVNSAKNLNFSKFPKSADTAYLSLAAHQNSLILNHPLMTLISNAKFNISGEDQLKTGISHNKQEIPSSMSLLNGSLPCDVHMVAFRTLSQPTVYPPGGDPSDLSQYPAPTEYRPSAALLVHRFGIERHIPSIKKEKRCLTVSDDAQISIDSMFTTPLPTAYNATLTLLHVDKEKVNGTLLLEPMEIRTWKIDFDL